MELTPRIAAEIRAEMARQQVSVTRLAEATGIPRSRLHRKLAASVPINASELGWIAQALSVPASELTRRAEGEAA